MIMKKLIILAFIVLLNGACTNNETPQEETKDTAIEISEEQFRAEKMVPGKPEPTSIRNKISVSGQIAPKPYGTAKVNVPVEGIVNQIFVSPGSQITKNRKLFSISGNALIDLQKDFAVSAAKIKQLKADYERAKKLFAEDINTENDFLSAESQYHAELAINKALELKLKRIGGKPQDIFSGNYLSEYIVRSPISGQIDKLAITPGQYVTNESDVAEIVNREKTELRLTIFENDIPKIKEGMKVLFGALQDNDTKDTAYIDRIGSKVGEGANKIEAFAKIDAGSGNHFAVNQIVQGEIITGSDTVSAVPRSAVIKTETHSYVLVLEQKEGNIYRFRPHKVDIGKSDEKNIELLNFDDNLTILLEGGHNLSIE